jgi:hypothetical protein
MDTSIYLNQAEKFCPKKINFLFIAESPPAFRGDAPVSYFYFVPNHGGDLLFASLINALTNDIYRNNPVLKESLLEDLQKNKKCFLMDAVQYPINRNRNWEKIPDVQRKGIIRDNEENFYERLKSLEEMGYIYSKSRFILIKRTVYNTLYEPLKAHYNVLNEDHIGFPRYFEDPLFVDKIRNLIVSQTFDCFDKMNDNN